MSTLSKSHSSIDIDSKYITTGQAAAILYVNRLTVRRWVKAGKLSGWRVGNVTLLNKGEVEKMAVERRQASAGAKPPWRERIQGVFRCRAVSIPSRCRRQAHLTNSEKRSARRIFSAALLPG